MKFFIKMKRRFLNKNRLFYAALFVFTISALQAENDRVNSSIIYLKKNIVDLRKLVVVHEENKKVFLSNEKNFKRTIARQNNK